MITAKKLRQSLDFSKEIEGQIINIIEGHPLFESNLKDWFDNHVAEQWINNDLVEITPENSDPFQMTLEEYKKI